MASPRRGAPKRSKWRDFIPPSELPDDEPIPLYGCGHWTPERDLTMARQDRRTGLWLVGDDRLADPCGTCGRAVEPGHYCESCFMAADRVEEKLEAEYRRDVCREMERIRREEEERAQESFADRMHGKKSA